MKDYGFTPEWVKWFDKEWFQIMIAFEVKKNDGNYKKAVESVLHKMDNRSVS